MSNSFARNLNTLLAETISDSLVRMRKHNTGYAKMLSKNQGDGSGGWRLHKWLY